MKNLNSIIHGFARKTIIVVGDLILDQHIIGDVSRISPEAPVPIVHQKGVYHSLGGASNVANNLRSLGAHVVPVGRIGSDHEGELLKKHLREQGIETSGVFKDKFPTTTKIRVVAQHQQIVRIDREAAEAGLSAGTMPRFFSFLKRAISRAHAVIISDYGKGMISPQILAVATEAALKKGIPIVVDPKVEHFECYKQVTAITPNKKECENAIRNIKIKSSMGHKLDLTTDELNTSSELDQAGMKLLNYLGLEALLLTLGEQGMRLYERDKTPFVIETKAKEVFDVTGAGDTVIAVFTLALTAGATKRQAAELANWAAGIVVGKLGAASVKKDELLQATKGAALK